MTLRAVDKIGPVTIKIQSRDGRYYLVYRDAGGRPKSKSTGVKAETKRQLDGGTPPAEVIKQARDLRKLLGSRFSRLLEKAEGPRIGDAINQAIKHSTAKTEERRDDNRRFRNYFTDWLSVHRPAVLYWSEVTPALVLDYVEYQHERNPKLKPKSLRHYIGPLTLTAKHMARTYPGEYFPLQIVSGYLQSDEAPAKNYLTAAQTARLMGVVYMRSNRAIPRVVMLGCYVGCNIKEIIRLRVQDFDLEAGLLTIRESKNKYRRRVIPLLPIVHDWIKSELIGMAVGDLFITNTEGFPATHHSVGASLRRVLDGIAEDFKNSEAFKSLAPKDIRKTFVNLCLDADVALSDIGAYVGHIPQGMTDEAYADVRRPDRLRRVVLDPLNNYLAKSTGGGAVLDMAKIRQAEG